MGSRIYKPKAPKLSLLLGETKASFSSGAIFIIASDERGAKHNSAIKG